MGKSSAKTIDGCLQSKCRSCANNVQHGLGLIERNAPIEVGPLGEFAAFGHSRSRRQHRIKDGTCGDDAPVAIDLHNVLARISSRGSHYGHEDFINHPPLLLDGSIMDGVTGSISQGDTTGRSKQGISNGHSVGTGEPDNADAAFANRRGNGGNRVVDHWASSGSIITRRPSPSPVL